MEPVHEGGPAELGAGELSAQEEDEERDQR